MKKYKYYTPIGLAEKLMELLPKKRYEKVIDICSGSWNLLRAANNKLECSRFLGVDLDYESGRYAFKNSKFVCEDGRIFALKHKMKYDLILSNPPFGTLHDDEKKFKNVKRGSRYEIEMIYANLLLAKPNAVLLLVLPSTLFEGETFFEFRRDICSKYTIRTIVKLPDDTFGFKRIRTYAVIIINSGKHHGKTSVKEARQECGKWVVSHSHFTSARDMLEGFWTESPIHKKVICDLEISRGNICSSQMSKSGRVVFHSSKNEGDKWYPSIRYCDNKTLIRKAKAVENGDIVINRVGKYAGYWCVIKSGGLASDCLLIIKTNNLTKYVKILEKKTVGGRLDLDVKGITSRYITKDDVLNLLQDC